MGRNETTAATVFSKVWGIRWKDDSDYDDDSTVQWRREMPRAFNWLTCVYIIRTMSISSGPNVYHINIFCVGIEREKETDGERKKGESWRSDLITCLCSSYIFKRPSSRRRALFIWWEQLLTLLLTKLLTFLCFDESKWSEIFLPSISTKANLQSEIDRQS